MRVQLSYRRHGCVARMMVRSASKRMRLTEIREWRLDALSRETHHVSGPNRRSLATPRATPLSNTRGRRIEQACRVPQTNPNRRCTVPILPGASRTPRVPPPTRSSTGTVSHLQAKKVTFSSEHTHPFRIGKPARPLLRSPATGSQSRGERRPSGAVARQ